MKVSIHVWAPFYKVIFWVKFPHRFLSPFHLSIQTHIKRNHKKPKKTPFLSVAGTIPSLSQKPERINSLRLHGSIQALSNENNPSCSHHKLLFPSIQSAGELSTLGWKLHYLCNHSFLCLWRLHWHVQLAPNYNNKYQGNAGRSWDGDGFFKKRNRW